MSNKLNHSFFVNLEKKLNALASILTICIFIEADQYKVSFCFNDAPSYIKYFDAWDYFIKFLKFKNEMRTDKYYLGKKPPLMASSNDAYEFMATLPFKKPIHCKKNINVAIDVIINFLNMSWLLFEDIKWLEFSNEIDKIKLTDAITVTLHAKKSNESPLNVNISKK